MYLLIDNYDSFTYNLYQAFALEGIYPVIKRNDEITIQDVKALSPRKIIISPGPKTPCDAGISNEVIREFSKSTLIMGICLGHQCIASVFGGKITRVKNIVHGKTSAIKHNGRGIFRDIPDPFHAARYHSLETTYLPDELEVTAETDNGIVMGIQHKELPVIGLQFHPESFMTGCGQKLIRNFIEM